MTVPIHPHKSIIWSEPEEDTAPQEATDVVYLHVRPLPDGHTVHRSVEIQPGLLVDLTPDGLVLGVERIGDTIGIPELVTVLAHTRWAQ